jgi:hypothetical protein
MFPADCDLNGAKIMPACSRNDVYYLSRQVLSAKNGLKSKQEKVIELLWVISS